MPLKPPTGGGTEPANIDQEQEEEEDDNDFKWAIDHNALAINMTNFIRAGCDA